MPLRWPLARSPLALVKAPHIHTTVAPPTWHHAPTAFDPMRSSYENIDKQMNHGRSFNYFLEKYGMQPRTGNCPSADSYPSSTLLLIQPVLIMASLCSAVMLWVMLEA